MKKLIAIVLFVAVIAGVGLFAFAYVEQQALDKKRAEEMAAEALAQYNRDPKTNMRLTDFRWNTLPAVSFKVANSNPGPIKDFTLSCTVFFDRGGREQSENHKRVIERGIKAWSDATYEGIRIPSPGTYIKSIGCSVESARAGTPGTSIYF